jgi:hypothetical protein
LNNLDPGGNIMELNGYDVSVLYNLDSYEI